jgi:Nitrile hydratase beta subunit
VTELGKFRVGDRVRVRRSAPGGNPRTPRYLRGWAGTVVRCHGVVDNPLDHHRAYPPLYSVVFPLPEGGSGDEVLADLHEEWLEAAPSAAAESAAGSSVADRT